MSRVAGVGIEHVCANTYRGHTRLSLIQQVLSHCYVHVGKEVLEIK